MFVYVSEGTHYEHHANSWLISTFLGNLIPTSINVSTGHGTDTLTPSTSILFLMLWLMIAVAGKICMIYGTSKLLIFGQQQPNSSLVEFKTPVNGISIVTSLSSLSSPNF